MVPSVASSCVALNHPSLLPSAFELVHWLYLLLLHSTPNPTHCSPLHCSDMLIDLCEASSEVGAQCGRLLGVGAVLQTAGQKATEIREEAYAFLTAGMKDERAAVKTAACR